LNFCVERSADCHKVGHFSSKTKLQIVAVPIIIASSDRESPAPVIVWTAPENPEDAPVNDDSKGWPEEIPFPSTFRLVHEVVGEWANLCPLMCLSC
jgi:aldos-2-ulose dehydratase